jgi:hypothetical protein
MNNTINKPKEPTLTELLNRVMPFINYKGVIIERLVGGFRIGNKKYKTIAELDEAINKSFEVINKSIINEKRR